MKIFRHNGYGKAPSCRLTVMGLCAVGLVSLSGNGAPAAENRSAAFELSCASCHTVGEGEENIFGPNLHGIVGRASGVAANFDYSPALASGKIQWTEEALDRYLESPNQFAAGTSMPFGGLPRKADRAEIIAYLKAAGAAHHP